MRNIYVLLQIIALCLMVYPFVTRGGEIDIILFALIAIVLFLWGSIGYRRETRVLKENKNLIKCPYCAESIKPEATICRYCKNKIDHES